MRYLIPILLFSIAGCATFSNMERGLKELVGREEKSAFEALGYPSFKQEFGNDIVYVWTTSNSGTMMVPQTATTYGAVGTTPIYGNTTYYAPMAVNYNCTVKVITMVGVVKSWDYEGNAGGCGGYSDRLNAYYKSVHP